MPRYNAGMASEIETPASPTALRRVALDNGLTVFVQQMRTAPLASVWCWYKVGSKDERAGLTGVVSLGRAHELQGDDQHSPRQGEGHHRAVRRQLERLHVDRSDDVPRNCLARRARPHALHRSGADGERPLSSRRLRVRAHGHPLGARGRRERPGTGARHRGHRGGLQGARLPPPDHRVGERSRSRCRATTCTATTAPGTSRTTLRSSSWATWTPTT